MLGMHDSGSSRTAVRVRVACSDYHRNKEWVAAQGGGWQAGLHNSSSLQSEKRESRLRERLGERELRPQAWARGNMADGAARLALTVIQEHFGDACQTVGFIRACPPCLHSAKTGPASPAGTCAQ